MGIKHHIIQAAHYGPRLTGKLYWWNLILRRFPNSKLPLRRRVAKLVHIPSGIKFCLRIGTTDWYVANEVLEEEQYSYVRNWDPASFRCVVDLGANIGLSVLLWGMLSPDATVIAVEPDPTNIELLRCNVDTMNFADRVVVLSSFVGRDRGWARLDRTNEEWGGKMKRDSGPGAIPVVTLDEICDGVPKLSSIDLLKCDIEGAEQEVFSTCRPWINRIERLIVELHPPYSEDFLLRDLRANDADMIVVSRHLHADNELVFLNRRSNSDS